MVKRSLESIGICADTRRVFLVSSPLLGCLLLLLLAFTGAKTWMKKSQDARSLDESFPYDFILTTQKVDFDVIYFDFPMGDVDNVLFASISSSAARLVFVFPHRHFLLASPSPNESNMNPPPAAHWTITIHRTSSLRRIHRR